MVYEGLHQPDDRVRKQRHGAGKKAGVTKEPALVYGAHIIMYYSDLTPGEVDSPTIRPRRYAKALLEEKQSEAFDDAVNARIAELGEVVCYPENVVEASYGDEEVVDDAADADAEADTLVVEAKV